METPNATSKRRLSNPIESNTTKRKKFGTKDDEEAPEKRFRTEDEHRTVITFQIPQDDKVSDGKIKDDGYQKPWQRPSQPKSLAMCFTSTGAALSLPPKKKDIYRPYSLDDKPCSKIRVPAEEDLHAAHAILDLSASPVFNLNPPNFTHQVINIPPPTEYHDGARNLQILEDYETEARNYMVTSPDLINYQDRTNEIRVAVEDESRKDVPRSEDAKQVDLNEFKTGKTVAYTYEAFFVSDGRSKRAREKADQKPDNRYSKTHMC